MPLFLCWRFCAGTLSVLMWPGGQMQEADVGTFQMGMPRPKRPAEGQGGAKMGVPCALWGDEACSCGSQQHEAAVDTERPLWANGRARA